MTESNVSADGGACGPWLIESSVPQSIDLRSLPDVRERRDFVGYVYVVAIGDDLVKVGKTQTPRSRLGSYVSESKLSGNTVRRLWVSRPHLNFHENERSLITFGQTKSKAVVRSEYFRGLRFQRFVEHAERLLYGEPTPEALQDLKAEAEARFASLKEMIMPGSTKHGQQAAEDLAQAATRMIGQLFGRLPDDSYHHGSIRLADDETGTPEQAERLWDAMCEIADAKGCCLECVLAMNAVDMMEDVITNIVKAEAARLYAYAAKNGHQSLIEPMGERIKRALPADDKRFDPDGASEDTHWDFDPELGLRRWVDGEDEPVEVVPVDKIPRCRP